jgi:hypothetical protein
MRLVASPSLHQRVSDVLSSDDCPPELRSLLESAPVDEKSERKMLSVGELEALSAHQHSRGASLIGAIRGSSLAFATDDKPVCQHPRTDPCHRV